MWRYVFIVGMISMSAVTWTQFLDGNQAVVDTAATIVRDQLNANDARQTARVETKSVARLSGTERIRADSRGHYVAEFRLNNARVKGLIDTGATSIAINKSTARRAGISLRNSDFIYTVNTANGQTNAARAVIGSVSVGSIRVNDVEAMVLDDSALDGVLIGMSFLQRLRSFAHENGSLVMKR